jgi:hypothetical protein
MSFYEQRENQWRGGDRENQARHGNDGNGNGHNSDAPRNKGNDRRRDDRDDRRGFDNGRDDRRGFDNGRDDRRGDDRRGFDDRGRRGPQGGFDDRHGPPPGYDRGPGGPGGYGGPPNGNYGPGPNGPGPNGPGWNGPAHQRKMKEYKIAEQPLDEKVGEVCTKKDPRGEGQRLTKKAASRGSGRNTESFDPATTLVRPDFRVLFGSNRTEQYQRPMKHDDGEGERASEGERSLLAARPHAYKLERRERKDVRPPPPPLRLQT